VVREYHFMCFENLGRAFTVVPTERITAYLWVTYKVDSVVLYRVVLCCVVLCMRVNNDCLSV
jgi:hypothetical protein